MKKFLVLSVLITLFISACSNKVESVKLEKDSPAYKLAQDMAVKVPFLDPDKNNVLISTNKFAITTGEVIQAFQTNFGKNADNLKNMPPEQINNMITRTAQDLAQKKFLLNAAAKANIGVEQAEIDSILANQYKNAGGEDKFLERLSSAGITIDVVRNDITDRLTINNYLDNELEKETVVTEEEITKAYGEDKTASVRHILLMTQGKSDSAKQEILKKMEGILDEAKQGKDFAELAKKYSEDPGSKNNGGLYKDFSHGRMVKPFEEAAFNTPIGELSGIVETQYGYHILKVVDRKKETKPIEEVHDQIEKTLKQAKQRDAYNNHIQKLKDEADYKVIEF